MFDEVERLRAIVDKLPKTADGVTVTDGMLLWPPLDTLHEMDDTETPVSPARYELCDCMDFPCGADKEFVVYDWVISVV